MLKGLSESVRHIVIGALVVVGIAVSMSYMYTSDRPGDDRLGYELIGKFRSIDGVAVGTPIMLAGIRVGVVADATFEPDTNAAVLTMSIRDGVELPYDSVAMIVSDGVFGGKYLKLTPGGELDMLIDGDQFEYVQDSIPVEELLEKVIVAAEARRKAKIDAANAETETEESQ